MNVQSTHQSTLQDFQVIHELGSGSFSNVYRVKRIADGQEYALKKVKIANLKPKEKQNALNEVRFLYSINHKHIVAYKEAFIDEPSQCLCIVMELLSGGDVYKKISQARGSTPFTEMDIWRALIHITLGLKALHDQKVVHRDLKSANVFLSSDGTFKLGDLNVSKVAKAGFVYTQTGTPYYASPEVWRDQPYDMKSDIWSLGCVIQLCQSIILIIQRFNFIYRSKSEKKQIHFYLQTPFRAKDMDLLFQKVQRGTYDQIQSHFSKDLSQIISSLLQIQPNNRPTCDQILANPIVQKHMKNLETNIETKPINKTLMETIQFPNNFKQLKNKLPKSNYDEVNPNVSADKVQDNKSTDKSTSPFRYPQQQYLPITESGISQSQNQSQVNVIQAQQPSPQQIKNNSILDKNLIGVQQPQPQIRQQPYNNKTEKPQSAQLNSRQNPYERAHELKEQKEREIRQQREKDQLLREKRERDAREAKLAKEAKEKQIQEAKEKQLQEAKLRESREQQRLLMEKQQREQQEQQQFRRVSPISAQPRDYQYANYINQQQPRSQHSYSPITRQVEQQNIQQGYNGQRVSYGNQVQQRPINSQSINVSQNHPNQYSRPYNQEISQHRISQTPQSAAPRQQYSPFQKPVTERYPAHPQSALPSSNIRESQKSERPQVFPTSAKVVKQRQSDTNLKKEFSSPTQQQAIRPAGKLTRQQSNNIFQQVDRIKSDPKPQNNFITGNYNHFYPIDNYKRHVSDQNLIKYQLRSQDKQALLRPQINNRKY